MSSDAGTMIGVAGTRSCLRLIEAGDPERATPVTRSPTR